MARKDYEPIKDTLNARQRRQVDAAELRALAGSVSALEKPTVHGAHAQIRTSGLGVEITTPGLPFWAKITGNDGSGNYSWVELWDDGAGTLNTLGNGRSGTLTTNQAREVHGILTVPTGEICKIWLTYDRLHYLFWYVGATDITFIADITFIDTITVTFDGPITVNNLILNPSGPTVVALKIVQPATPSGDVFDYYKSDGTTKFFWQGTCGDLYLAPWCDVVGWTYYQPATPTKDVLEFYKNDRTTLFFWLGTCGDMYWAPWCDVVVWTIYQPGTTTKNILEVYKNDRTTKLLYLDKFGTLKIQPGDPGSPFLIGKQPDVPTADMFTFYKNDDTTKIVWLDKYGTFYSQPTDPSASSIRGIRPDTPTADIFTFYKSDGTTKIIWGTKYGGLNIIPTDPGETALLLKQPGTPGGNIITTEDPSGNPLWVVDKNGKTDLVTPTTSTASLNFPNGTAPTSPATGDTWSTTAGLFLYNNSITQNVTPLTTKGDLYGFDTTTERIPIGSDGDVLTADSAQTLGLKWAAAGGGTTGTNGYNSDTNAYTVTSSWAQCNSVQVTLPTAGTYLVIGECEATIEDITFVNDEIQVRLWNNTTSAQIGMDKVAASNPVLTAAGEGSTSIAVVVTTSSINNVIKLQAQFSNGMATPTVAQTARHAISYVKLA